MSDLFLTMTKIRGDNARPVPVIAAALLALIICACAPVPDHCSDHNRYDRKTQFCFQGEAIDKCGGKTFDPTTHGCDSADNVREQCPGGIIPNPGATCAGDSIVAPPTTYTLTTSAAPAAGGTVTRNPDAARYDAGTEVRVTAAPAQGYTFVNWSGASTSSNETVTVTMNGNRTLTANFRVETVTPPDTTIPPPDTTRPPPDTIRYTLTTTVIPAGRGTVTRNPNATSYVAGTEVTLTATPAQGYVFANWSGASTAAVSPLTITINANTTLTANFREIQTPGLDSRLVNTPGTGWSDNIGAGRNDGYVFREDGTLAFMNDRSGSWTAGGEGTWSTLGNNVTINGGVYNGTWEYTVAANGFTLLNPNGSVRRHFVRVTGIFVW
jgi:uncharacterized repeat protein (TIGR02543 family)